MNYYERYDKYPSRIEGILLEEFGVMDDAPAIADTNLSRQHDNQLGWKWACS